MFVHLSARSFYSFGIGTASIETLCLQARARGFEAIALTDVNGLYGIGWFLRAASDNGLKAIIGAEVRHASGRAVLLAYSREGYSNLCHILSARHLEPNFSLARALVTWRAGVVIISDSFALLEDLAGSSSREHLYVELRPGQNVSRAINFSRQSRIAAIITNDVHFLDPQDYELLVKLRAIALKKTLKTVPPAELASPDAWLKTPDEMRAAFDSYPEALANADRVAEQCAAFQLEFTEPIFPRYSNPDGRPAGEVLRELAIAAAHKKYFGSSQVMERLEKELEIIIRKGFADTFLVMRDIVKLSRYTCGRGSAAASLVSYLLGITDMDPISCDLYFGRFLNDARTDPPDIDMDFCRDERRPIIETIFERYGAGKVAMVANHNTMGMRQAIRRLAELEGIPQTEIATVTRRFSGWGGSIQEFTLKHPAFRGIKLSDKWPRILQDAERLVGIPTHLSLHPGGIVIAAEGIDHYIPRQRSRNGLIAIHTEKDQTEDILKLVKIDVLGNSSLCVIKQALEVIQKKHGVEIDFRDWRRFAADTKVRELITQARTMACFHIESASFLQLLEKIGPGLKHAGPQKIFDTLVILSSIIRPASNKSIQEYLRRFYGGKFEYLHPKLEPILAETLGIVVYQEHVNLLAMALAGFSEVEADRLRKALTGKKSDKLIRELMQKYLEGCRQNGISQDVAQQTAQQILQFVHYSFLKAHSASYVILALACVYLKVYYPAIYMAARLSHAGGFWGFRAYVSECQRMGLRVLLPDINASQVECTGEENAVRIGLMRIKGVSLETKKRIIVERQKNGRFASFPNFLLRVPVAEKEMERLIMAGIFDALEPGLQQTALQYLHAHWVGLGKPRDFSEWYPQQRDRAGKVCQPYSEDERLRNEIEVLGTLISRHPLERYREKLGKIRRVMAKDLRKHVGKMVTLVGWPIASKQVTTKHDEPMEFWSFEDESGVFHAVLFPRVYQQFQHSLLGTCPTTIIGTVQQAYHAITLNAINCFQLQ